MRNPYRVSRQGHGVASFAGGGEFLFDLADLPLILRHTWHLGRRGYPLRIPGAGRSCSTASCSLTWTATRSTT